MASLTFINYNAKGHGVAEDRSTINSHVAKVSHKRRIKESIERLEGYNTSLPRRPDVRISPAPSRHHLSAVRGETIAINRPVPHRAKPSGNGFQTGLQRGRLSSGNRFIEIEDPEDNVEYIERPEATRVVTSRNGSRSLLSSHIGGFRDDPFNMLPIESTGYVTSGFDYFTQVYGPLALRLGNCGPSQYRLTVVNLLEDAMLCESIVSLMLMMQNLYFDNRSRMSKAVIYHSNNAIVKLRERLMSPTEAISDVVIMTTISQAVIHRMASNYDTFNTHISGVKKMVALRGGLDNLGWNGMIKISAIGVFESWDAAQKQNQQRSRSAALGLLDPNTLTYPTGPYPPALLAQISRLPLGFQALARHGGLSHHCLDFFDLCFIWLADPSRWDQPITEVGHDIIGMPGLTRTERILTVAMQAYLNYLERTERLWSNTATEYNVRVQVTALADGGTNVDCDPDALAWACLMLRATTERESEPWRWADRVLESLQMQEEREIELRRLFHPVPVPLNATLGASRARWGV